MTTKGIPNDSVCELCDFPVTEDDGIMMWGVPIHLDCMLMVEQDMEKQSKLFDKDKDDPFGDDQL